MLILHAGSIESELFLWGERTRDIPPEREAAAADRAQLVAALQAGGFEASPRDIRAKRVVAWLPSVGAKWIPSSPLLDVPVPSGKPKITPHVLEALGVADATLDALLAATARRPLLAPSIIAGDDLAFWTRAFSFAARLVAARRYVPTVVVSGERGKALYEARWQAVLGPGERAALATLGETMPAACRALALARKTAPAHARSDVLRAFVENSVDRLVRRAAPAAKIAAADGVIADRWLCALRSSDARLDGEVTELRAFADHVTAWVRDVSREDDAPYRLFLRLEEPVGDRKLWFVRYLLQSQSDRSLLVAGDAAWKSASLRRPMLDAVGRAARIAPRIDATLHQKRPDGFALDNDGAHAFLTQEARLLESAGLGLLLPSWWTSRGTHVRLGVQAQAKAHKGPSAGLRLNAIVDVDWKVALGGEPLSARELTELARLKSPLVRLRGQWVVVEADDIRAALEMRERRTQAMQLGDLVRMSLTGTDQRGTLRVDGVSATGDLRVLLDRLAGRAAFETLAPPRGLRATLRPYQERGYSWLRFHSALGLGACLADDMGLGKTVQTLALFVHDWQNGVRAPVLLVCPTSVMGNWQREAARFAPQLPLVVHHGADRRREALLLEENRTAVVVTSYGLLQRDLDALRSIAWHGVVLDEAQNVKNPESKQARAARALTASYRLALTGTPVENHVGDLWALMEFLNPGLLGTNASFRRNFLIPIASEGDAIAQARLRTMTAPFVLRRLKSDPSVVPDLPKKLEMRVFCQLTKEQASLYAAVLRDVQEQLEDSEGIARKGLVLATLTKLKQVCNHPANLLHDDSPLDGRSGKLARLAEMLEEVWESGDRALVFTQFTEMAAMIRRHLQATTGREVLYLHGGVRKAERDRMVARFQDDAGAPATFVLSLRAGGTGLNLTRANHVFHFDRWWNPAVEAQASDRAYRIGQRKDVLVHRLVCAGTVEEKIDALLERKDKLASRIVSAGEAGLTELSNVQLREVFALSTDAVAAA